jgi:hypothetical protein
VQYGAEIELPWIIKRGSGQEVYPTPVRKQIMDRKSDEGQQH